MALKVDLPLPFSPINPVISPLLIEKSTWLSATVGPKCLEQSSTLNIIPFGIVLSPSTWILIAIL